MCGFMCQVDRLLFLKGLRASCQDALCFWVPLHNYKPQSEIKPLSARAEPPEVEYPRRFQEESIDNSMQVQK